MRTTRHLLASCAALAMVIAGMTAGSAAPPTPEAPPPSDATIEPQVLEELADSGTTTVWVRFDARPDMSQFEQLTDRDARGIAVYEALTSTARTAQSEVRAALDSDGLSYQTYWATNAIRVEGADADVVNDLARAPGVQGIYGSFTYEAPVTQPADGSTGLNAVEWGVQDIQADDVWAEGVTGEGMVVANIDSGVQWDHPALINQYRGWDGSTADHDYNWFDGSGDDEPAPWDWDGHGTHTMGTMVGDDGGSNQIGVAPGAQWIAASVDLSDAMMIAAGEWMLAPTEVGGANPDPTMRPDVVNNSWGSEEPSNDPFMEDVIEAWHAAGIFSVFSNGNEGPACETSGSPGSRIVTYSVGSYDAFHTISGFSSRGPGQDGEVKPNISAPGANVRSSFPGDQYGSISGTSMAAPHVSGAVALLWSNGGAAVGDVAATRALLDGSAIDTADAQCGGTAEENNVYGEGRLDAYALIFGDEPPEIAPAISVDPTSIEGTQVTDEQVEHTLTIANTGTADLEFTIAEVAAAAGVDLALPQGTDRQSATDSPGAESAPAVVEPDAVPAVASLSEGFDDINTLPGAGWAITNNSEPTGANNWFQGNPVVFDAHEGAPEAYVAANFNSAGDAPGHISNWLMTPELDLVNGSEFSFWTRTVDNPASWVDRLEVRLSTSGDSTDVGTGYDGVGDFDTLLLSVNPDLTPDGYPGEWTQYTATVEGLEASTTGRLAFHYWVPDGGPLGVNSNFIGIDTVAYEAAEDIPPCEVLDAPWLTVDPTTGTVSPDGEQAVTVSLDSTGLAVGEYTADLCIESNDPQAPVTTVPVTLSVVEEPPAVPVIGVDPASVEVELETGAAGEAVVAVSNTGEADLSFDVIEAAAGSCDPVDAAWLSVDPATGTVAPGEATEVALSLDATGLAAGEYTADLCITSNDEVTGTVSVPVTLTVSEEPDPEPAQVIRIDGQDRYETSTLIAQEFPEGAHTVYVANGLAEFQGVDALVTGAVAGGGPRVPTDGPAPILLVKNDDIPNVVAAALGDLDPQEIVIVGGELAVNATVEAELVATGADVSRIGGGDRFETAAALAQDYPAGGTVYVATGTGPEGTDLALADALTSASVAGHHEVPVLLTQTDNLPNVTETALAALAPEQIVLVGGPVAVNEDVEDALNQIAPTTRLWGQDRYETATALTGEYPADTDRLYVASGTNFPDALVGAALTSSQGQPMLIVRPGNLPAVIKAEAERLSPQGITIFGGPIAVDDTVKDALQAILDITSLD